MIRSISTITDISMIEQLGNENILLPLKSLSYFESEIGSGAFGNVYNIESINGIQSQNYVIKLISNEGSQEHAYYTINLLHNKIKKTILQNNKSIYHTNPELLGLPFLVFRAVDEIEGKPIVGMLMYNLVKLDYSDFGSDSFDKKEYLKTEIPDRIYYGYQFAKTINLFHDIGFIHSDLAEDTFWLSNKKKQITIIDYDSGYHFDYQDKPTTLGKISQWTSSLFKNYFQNKDQKAPLTKEDRLHNEYWQIASSIFELLVGVSPYFFLTDTDDITIKKYLKEEEWPNINTNSEFFNNQNEDAYKEIINFITQLKNRGLDNLISAFSMVFNKGYSNEKHRLNTKEWKDLLFDLCSDLELKPEISKFISNKQTVKSTEDEVLFEWDYSRGNVVSINDNIVNSNGFIKKFDDNSEVTLKITNDFGEASETIRIEALKIPPAIRVFTSDTELRTDLDPVKLSWETVNSKYVLLENFEDRFSSNDSHEVNPLEKTVYKITAVGNFGEEVNAEIEIDILKAKILSFKYEINIEKGIQNIDLFWETENSIEVEISPRIGKVNFNGQTDVSIIEKTEFTIYAKSHFDQVSKIIETQPFPIPVIKGIFIPTPILNMETLIPVNSLEIPAILNNNLNISYNNSVSFHEMMPQFKELDNYLDNKNNVENQKTKFISPVELFGNLFKKIHK